MTHPRSLPSWFVLAACAAPSLAQTLVHAEAGTNARGRLGHSVAAIGDLDGDSVPDFLVAEPNDSSTSSPPGRVHAISGRTWQPLYSVTVGSGLPGIVHVLGDVDGDGRRDFVTGLAYGPTMTVRSGATGASIRLHGSAAVPYAPVGCDLGDVDNDGRDDYASIAMVNSAFYLAVHSGRTGAQLNTFAGYNNVGWPERLVAVGDVTGNGRVDVAWIRIGQPIALVRTDTGALLRTLDRPQGGSSSFAEGVAAIDLDGDGRPELAVTAHGYDPPGTGGSSAAVAFSTTTGSIVRTFALPDRLEHRYSNLRHALAAVDDLDADGTPDLAVADDDGNSAYPYQAIRFFSGRTGSLLSTWRGASGTLYERSFANVGDLDGDGRDDLLVGAPWQGTDRQGGWLVVSPGILATLQFLPVACTGGPFPPELGVTRPVLGQNVTIVGRDAPANAFGAVAFGLAPVQAQSTGVSGCDVWFDRASFQILFAPPAGPNWSATVPLPNVPQLAGLEVALQAIYWPTLGPQGFDLSNGVWARLGN